MTLGLLGLSPDLVKIFSAQHDIASINFDFPTPNKDKLILMGEKQELFQIKYLHHHGSTLKAALQKGVTLLEFSNDFYKHQ